MRDKVLQARHHYLWNCDINRGSFRLRNLLECPISLEKDLVDSKSVIPMDVSDKNHPCFPKSYLNALFSDEVIV